MVARLLAMEKVAGPNPAWGSIDTHSNVKAWSDKPRVAGSSPVGSLKGDP